MFKMIRPDFIEFKYSNELYHYGVKRRSGRYPWGSGERPYQRMKTSGNYKLSKYQGRYGYYGKKLLKRLGHQTLAMIIPGYALAYNTRSLIKMSKGFDFTEDYTKKDGAIEKVSELKRKSKDSSLEEDLKNVNPGSGKRGTVKNCVNCSIAMEMRRRGYDVQARKTSSGVSISEYRNAFKNPEIHRVSYLPVEGESEKKRAERAYNSVMNKLESYGEGARGSLIVTFSKFTGKDTCHALNWEVRDGRTIVSDPQAGKTGRYVMNTFSIADPSDYMYVRLDNLKVSKEITKNVVSKKER